MAPHLPSHIALCTAFAAFAMLSPDGARAQSYAGPTAGMSTSNYVGPSSIPVTSVKDLLDKGRDDQYAVMRGRIVSHDGGQHYTFDDGTGRIAVEIKPRHFPTQQTIDDNTAVELAGKLDRGFKKTEFDVKQIRIQ